MEISLPRGKPLSAYQVAPSTGSGPGVVLVQLGSGLNLRPVADLFAEEGYMAVAADLPPEVADDAAQGIACLSAVLQARPVGAGKVGVIGFGKAGLLTYLAASQLPMDAAAVFDAPELDRQPETDPELRCPMILHFGGKAASISKDAIQKVRALLSRSADIAIFEYPDATPGFYVPGHDGFEHLAAQLAHSRTIALFRRTLGLSYDLDAIWEAHLNWEFVKVEAEGTMTTMIAEPVNLNVPVLTGGIGQDGVLQYYKTQFLGQMPKDAHLVPISRTVGADRVVDEHLLCFTHDREMDAMLPGIPPTGKYVELPVVVIVTFRGDKVAGEHIYWDQACLLVQIGKLAKKGLPVHGIECAKRLRDEGLPAGELKERWEKET